MPNSASISPDASRGFFMRGNFMRGFGGGWFKRDQQEERFTAEDTEGAEKTAEGACPQIAQMTQIRKKNRRDKSRRFVGKRAGRRVCSLSASAQSA